MFWEMICFTSLNSYKSITQGRVHRGTYRHVLPHLHVKLVLKIVSASSTAVFTCIHPRLRETFTLSFYSFQKPTTDGIDTLFIRRKNFCNLCQCPVFSIVRRFWMRNVVEMLYKSRNIRLFQPKA